MIRLVYLNNWPGIDGLVVSDIPQGQHLKIAADPEEKGRIMGVFRRSLTQIHILNQDIAVTASLPLRAVKSGIQEESITLVGTGDIADRHPIQPPQSLGQHTNPLIRLLQLHTVDKYVGNGGNAVPFIRRQSDKIIPGSSPGYSARSENGRVPRSGYRPGCAENPDAEYQYGCFPYRRCENWRHECRKKPDREW